MRTAVQEIEANETTLRRFRPHPAYRDSGIEWLGRVPTNWTVERLKWTVVTCRNGTWGSEPDGIDDIVCVRVADFDRTAFRVSLSEPTFRAVTHSERNGRILCKDDLLIEKSGGGELQPVGAVVHFHHDIPAVSSNFVARMPIRKGFDARYLAYFHAHLYTSRVNTRSIKQTTGIQNLDSMSYLSELAAWPQLQEQRTIATFLDRETARIDALIAKKKRLIELLHEKRAVVITDAVTKGLNPNAPMKDSGIPWLGKLPKHWQVKRIKFAGQIGNGSTPSRENPEYWDGWFPWLNSSVVNLTEVTEPTELVSDVALRECHLPRITPPAVLVGITGEGKTRGMVTLLRIEATINQHLAFVRPRNHDCVVEYVRYVLHAAYQFLRDESDGGGSTKGAITCNRLGNTAIPFPPANEQVAIARHINSVSAKLDALVTLSETAITRLDEYRQSLISAAVTGKIDVRNHIHEEAPCP